MRVIWVVVGLGHASFFWLLGVSSGLWVFRFFWGFGPGLGICYSLYKWNCSFIGTNIICDLTLVERFTIYTLLDQSKLDREAEKLEFALLLRLLPELNVAPLSAPYTALNCTFVVKMTGSKGLNKQ